MTFLAQEVIRRKRDGGALTPEEILDRRLVAQQVGEVELERCAASEAEHRDDGWTLALKDLEAGGNGFVGLVRRAQAIGR